MNDSVESTKHCRVLISTSLMFVDNGNKLCGELYSQHKVSSMISGRIYKSDYILYIY